MPAIEFSAPCAQPDPSGWYRSIAETFAEDPSVAPDLGQPSEDCLYLNVWTTNQGGAELQPVMVWIHGGGNTAGSSSEPGYDGSNLARKGGVVVSINYRLGLLGFLAHPELTAESDHRSSGNYGLLDQIEALRWVQRNITAFGGDADRVTIFGESAGGANVGYLMASPLADGLFHRAISQSGGYQINDMRTLAEQESAGIGLATQLGIDAEGRATTRLRGTSVDELFAAARTAAEQGADRGVALRPAPSTDGWVLPQSQARNFAGGQQRDIPLLLGANLNESDGSSGANQLDAEGFRDRIRESFGKRAQRALALYSISSQEDVKGALGRWRTDATFLCGSKFMARSMAKVSSQAYLYHFIRVLPGPGGARLGAFHGIEIDYVFDNTLVDGNWYLGFPLPFEAVDHALAENISNYWVQFAATGDPNRDSLPAWPAYEPVSDQYLELGDKIVARSGLRVEACALFEEILEERMAELSGV